MKRKLLLGLLFLATSLVSAQVQIIDDPAFEDELIRLGHDSNPTRDGQILISDAEAVTFLNLTGDDNFNANQNEIGLGITNLNGIKAFSNLEILWVQGNDLIELDLEGISSLKDVRAFFNDLERINVNGLSNLEIIGLNVNKLKGINVSTNTSLQTFDIAQNNLLSVDLSGLIELTSANFQDNSQLSCILVEDATTANSYNGDVAFRRNGTTVFSENCPNIYTQIPDRNFELSLIAQGYDSEGGIPNGLVLTQDLEAITNLDLSGTNFSGENISSLEGLDAFTGLTDLNISYNPLNLPNNDLVLTNTQLETIIARNCNLDGASFPTILNEVVTLDFSNEDPRNITIPSVNSFNTINGLGGVPNVITFRIEWNNLTLLEVAGAQKIEKLFLGKNFDLTEIRSLNTLVNLNQMEADDNSLGLGNPVGTIDVSGNSKLEVLNLDRSKITAIDLSNNPELRLLSISDVNLSPTIDLSANTNLTFLDLVNSQLSSLSIASNTELDRIELDRNNLTTLDVSQNNKLIEIQLANNSLSALNISNTDTNLSSFNTTGNSDLNCIQVSDLANVRNSWEKDAQTSYSVNCNSTEKTVEVSVISGQQLDANNFYTVVSANEPMQIGFNLLDENGDELDAGVLANYGLNLTTMAATNQNPAQGGNVNTPGVDFELLTNEPIQINTADNASDGNRTIAMNEDQLFEADEYFFIQISTNDPNIALKNAVNGVVEIPVKIEGNEITNVSLELLDNGIEGSQNVKVRINSSLVNNTGANMPFTIALQNGSAMEGADFELNDTTIQLPNGQSFVDVDITALPDQDATEGTEDFSATVSYVGGIDPNRINITNGTVTATIADDTATGQPFIVSTAIGGDVVEVSGTACCPEYEIEEGQLLEISFDAEANATIGEEYIVQVSFANGMATEQDVSVRENSPNFQYTYSVKSASPDNILQIDIVDDMIEEVNGENLKITLTPAGSNYAFSGTTVYDVIIKDKTPTNNGPYTISTALIGAGDGPYYEVKEDTNFELQFASDALAASGDTFAVEVTYGVYNIIEVPFADEQTGEILGVVTEREEQNDIDQYPDIDVADESTNNIYTFEVKDGAIDGILNFEILDDDLPEETEEIIIDIKSLTPGITFNNSDRYVLKILRNDGPKVEVTLQDISVTEGKSVEIVFNNLPDNAFPNYNTDESTASREFYTSGGDFGVNYLINSTLTVNAWLDALPNENEQIKIQLLAPIENYSYVGANDDGSLDFTIDILDGEEFEVVVNIEDATFVGANFYEVNEGDSFSVTFEPAVDDLDILPNSFPVEINTDLGSAEIETDFRLSPNSFPDIRVNGTGTATYETIVDGVADQDELIIVNLPKPSHPYKWQNAETMPDGSLQFTIRVKDQNITEPLNDYTIKVSSYNSEIDEFTPVQGSSVVVSETDRLRISFESENYSPAIKGISINPRDGSAQFEEGDFSTISDHFDIRYFDSLSVLDIYFSDTENDEPEENFFIEISPTTSNYNLLSPDGNVLDLNEKFVLEVIIQKDDNSTSSNGNPQRIIDAVANAQPISGDVFYKEYSATREKPIQIDLDDFQPNSNAGKRYDLPFKIDDKSTLQENDYSLTIVNDAGDNLLNNGTINYVVQPNNIFDARINISVNENVDIQTPKTLILTLTPDVTRIPFEAAPDEFVPNAIFYESTQGSSTLNNLEYKFTISSEDSGDLVNPTITHTGGVEGLTDKPDTITCTLKNSDGTDYTAHTSNILIPFEFSNEILDGVGDQDVRFSSMVFDFQPGENTAEIKAFYRHELDEKDAECNYYEIRLKQPTQNAGANIEISGLWKLMKVADYSEFLVFVDLVLDNVQPRVANLSFNDPGYQGPCLKCIEEYLVEENTTIKFKIDAANGVPQARDNTDISNAYILDLDIGYNSSKKGSPIGNDISLVGGPYNLKQIPIYVKQDATDEEIWIEVDEINNNEGQGESFRVTFKEPEERKTYRFSQRDSRTYGNFFDFKIVNVVALSIKTEEDYDEINEENPSSIGKITINSPNNESFNTNTPVNFKLEGSAEFGESNDYMIMMPTSNNIKVNKDFGTVYFNEGQSSVTLDFIVMNDDIKEVEENIKLTLIDDFGYSVGATGTSQSAELTIVDNDAADFDVTITSSGLPLFEDRSRKYSDLITIELLDEINDTGETLNIKLSLEGSEAIINQDFKLYLLTDGEKTELNTPLTVPIPNGSQKSEILVETLIDELNEEGPEELVISLVADVGYFPIDPKDVNITIFSAGEDSVNGEITAKVISSTCEGLDRGQIAMTNASEYDYDAILLLDGNEYREGRLEAYQTESLSIFDKLPAGKYTVFLTYDLGDDQTKPENIEPPSFSLVVRTAPATELISSDINQDLRVANLRVSGSKQYFVINNGKTYEFTASSNNLTELQIPLLNGKNEITISGDSECQDKIQTSLFLNTMVTYPNPTADQINLVGFNLNSHIELLITDLTGRIIKSEKLVTTSEVLKIDLSTYAPGTYLAKITLETGSKLSVKLIKK